MFLAREIVAVLEYTNLRPSGQEQSVATVLPSDHGCKSESEMIRTARVEWFYCTRTGFSEDHGKRPQPGKFGNKDRDRCRNAEERHDIPLSQPGQASRNLRSFYQGNGLFLGEL